MNKIEEIIQQHGLALDASYVQAVELHDLIWDFDTAQITIDPSLSLADKWREAMVHLQFLHRAIHCNSDQCRHDTMESLCDRHALMYNLFCEADERLEAIYRMLRDEEELQK